MPRPRPRPRLRDGATGTLLGSSWGSCASPSLKFCDGGEVGEVGREAGGVGGDPYEDGSEDRTSRKMASIRLLSDSSRRMLYPLGGADPATSEANSDAVASSEANLGEAASSTAHRSRQTSASMPSSLAACAYKYACYV